MKRNQLPRILTSYRRRLLAGFGILFGAIGVYTLLQSKAAITPADFKGSGFTASYTVYDDSTNPNEQHVVGSTFARNYYLYSTPGGTFPQGPHHIQFYIRWYSNEVKHLDSKFACGSYTPCVKVIAHEPGAPAISNLIYCFDVTQEMRSQGNVKLFSTEFQQVSATAQNWFDDLLYMFDGECSGYYENGPPANDPNYLGSSWLVNGNLGNGTILQAKDQTQTTGNGNGSGTQGNGTGSGASGSSSAVRQSTEPNSIAVSSGQDSNKQSELEASPFYDGKNYERGSDTDATLPYAGTVGTNAPRPWLIILGAFILLLSAGFLSLMLLNKKVRQKLRA